MKFTKTAVAVAIAGIAAAPMMASAETTLAGAVQMNFQGSDQDGDDGDVRFAAGDVNINLNAQQSLNSGLTGYANYRLDADAFSGGDLTGDSIHVGIRGGFGDVRIGEIPVVAEYGQVSNDIFDVTDSINTGISYEGNFGGFTLGLNWSPDQSTNDDVVGVGAKFSIGGFGIGVGVEERADVQNASAGVTFGIAGASIAAHFATSEAGAVAGEDREIVGVKLGYGIAGVALSLSFMSQDNNLEGFETAVRLDAGYDLGGGMGISTRITQSSDSVEAGVDDLLEYRVQLSKSF